MDSLGVFIISNNHVFLERALDHVNSLNLFDYVLVTINSKEQDKFYPLRYKCNKMDFVDFGNQIETGLVETASKMPTDWLMRIDDDEQLDQAMISGLRDLTLCGPKVYWFPRKWLWPTNKTFIVNPPWYPDVQVKLWHKSCKILHAKMHDHTQIDGARFVDVNKNILHYNLLWKTYEERMARNAEYAKVLGVNLTSFLDGLGAFYLPEDHKDIIKVWEL